MTIPLLFLFVEGDDDERLLRDIILPRLEPWYASVKLIRYANMSDLWVDNYLRSIASMPADLIFLADKDTHPCITSKKQELTTHYKHLSPDNIVVISREIESWYLAGVLDDPDFALRHRLPADTDNLSKEQFIWHMPESCKSRLLFMLEIVKVYSLEKGCGRNKSLKYFFRKHLDRSS